MKSQVNQSSPKKTFVCSTKNVSGKQTVVCQAAPAQKQPVVQAKAPQKVPTKIQPNKVPTKFQVPKVVKPNLKSNQSIEQKFAVESSGGKWDYIVVGAGTAGCALAAKLSDPDPISGLFVNSVLLLETGVNYTTEQTVNELPAAIYSSFGYDTDTKYAHPYIGFLEFDSPSVAAFPGYPISHGRAWGGSSQINNILAVRGTPSLYTEWVTLSGNSRWAYSNMLNDVMKPLETFNNNIYTSVSSNRGTAGPVFMTQEPSNVATDPFAIAISAGFGTPPPSAYLDYNDPANGDVGVSSPQDFMTGPWTGQFPDPYPTNRRSFSGTAFLTGEPTVTPPVAANVDANGNGIGGRRLLVVSEATVTRVLFSSSKRAKAVEYFLSTNKNDIKKACSGTKIILCGGGIQSPAILQRSGVGDLTLLNDLGIPVVFNNPHVGQHLKNHYYGLSVVNMPTATTFPQYTVGFTDVFASTGTTTNRTIEVLTIDNVLFIPNGIRNAMSPSLNDTSVYPAGSLTTVALGVLTPQSEGFVKIVRQDPTIDPNVFFNFFSDGGPLDTGSDANKVVEFLRQLNSPSAFNGQVLYPTPDDYADATGVRLLQTSLATPLVNYHYSCTCRMALTAGTVVTDNGGVVDGNLQVFGVTGLMVADNSIAPQIMDGNTASCAYYIGLMAARILAGL